MYFSFVIVFLNTEIAFLHTLIFIVLLYVHINYLLYLTHEVEIAVEMNGTIVDKDLLHTGNIFVIISRFALYF